jgi:YebC/PmpR family DNA-binding regulatory protein
MSGHNKWSQIKHRKGAADKARSTVWGKLAKRIIVESRIASGDVTSPTLRTWIEKARKENMPKENIERAVQKGITHESGSMESIIYETYGPGGCAILIATVTDSRNRTAQEIKHLLTKHGLSLANPGSAQWAFEKDTEGGFVATTTVLLSETESTSLMQILEAIDNHDDVENVYTNAT